MLSLRSETSNQPGSAFKKCEPGQAPEGRLSDLSDYRTPPLSFSEISERTPNKRIRSEHGKFFSSVNPLERLRAEGSPRSLAGARAKGPSMVMPRRIGCSPAQSSGHAFAVPMPIDMPASVVPLESSAPLMTTAADVGHIVIREPPPGVEVEVGICWLDTTRGCGVRDHTPAAWSFGSTPEMPKEKVPWCGTLCPPPAPRLAGQRCPRNLKDVHGFDLPESERVQSALWQASASLGGVCDGWSTDEEDGETDMLSNSFSRDLGLSGEPQSPDMVPQFRARRRERVSFSPIQGTVAEPESPTFGGAMAATPDLLSAPLHIGMSATPDLGAPLHLSMGMSATPDFGIPRMGYSATPDLSAPLHIGMSATPDLGSSLGMHMTLGMSMTPDLSAPLRAPPMRDMQPHAQPMRDSSDDFELSPDNFGDLNIDDGEPLFDFSPGPNRTPSPELDQMDQIAI